MSKMKRLGMKAALLCTLLSMGLTPPAQAASFDCAKASTKIEKLICTDAALSLLDEELAGAYKAALQDEKQADSIRQAQKQWMKERNTCDDAYCVKRTYAARLEGLSNNGESTGRETVAPSTTSAQVKADQTAIRKPPFTLIKGKGIPVCEAYLKRLNVSEFGICEKLPTCGRPENDSVEGFTKLNRVPLTAEQISALYGGVSNFSSQGNCNRDSSLSRNPMKAFLSIERSQQEMADGSPIAWHYDPPVDIDNDGKQDTDLVVWQGYGLDGGVGGLRCGGQFGPLNRVVTQPTVILSIDWQEMKLNEARICDLFEHPVGGYPVMFHGKRVMADAFRPIGRGLGIFAYQGKYYFDTFFDGWGDFEGKRRSDWGDGKRRIKNDLRDILGVFQRKEGVTKQVCEYRWNEYEQYLK